MLEVRNMTIIESHLGPEPGVLGPSQPSEEIDMLLKHCGLCYIGVVARGRPQFMVKKIESASEWLHLLLRHLLTTPRGISQRSFCDIGHRIRILDGMYT